MEFIDNAKSLLSNDESLLAKTAIGTLVLLTSIFILPYFIYQGYLVRILKHTDEPVPDGLPEWSNIGGLFKDGFIAFIISMIVSIPGILISAGPQLAGLGEALILIGSLVGTVVSLVTSYLLVAIYTVGFRDGFGEAFSLSRLMPILFSKEYLAYWGVALLIGFAVGLVSIPIILFTFGFGLILLVPVLVIVNFAVMALGGLAITEVESTGSMSQTSNNTTQYDEL